MPVRGWLHQASKRLLSRSGKNQVSRQRNGTVKPSGLRLHATPCTHPGPANCITSCSDAKKKLSWLTFSSSGEFWVFDTDLRPGICQIRTASNSHFTPDSQIPDSRHERSEFLPKLESCSRNKLLSTKQREDHACRGRASSVRQRRQIQSSRLRRRLGNSMGRVRH